jgi:hypothetical protein
MTKRPDPSDPTEASAPAEPRRRGWWPYAGLFGAAVGIVVAVRSGVPPRDEPQGEPQYTPEWRSGKRAIRGEGDPPAVGCASKDLRAPRFLRGGRFEIVFAPERAGRGAPASSSIGGHPVPTEVGDDGVVRILSTVGAGPLALEPGWYCLETQVGAQEIDAGFWVDPG